MNDTILTLQNLTVHRFVMPGIESNMYLMIEDGSALIVDPNINADALSLMRESGVSQVRVLLTHEHSDHISGVNWLRENFSVEVYTCEMARQALQDPARNLAKFWQVLVMGMPPEKMEAAMAVADEDYACFADVFFEDEMEFEWKKHSVRLQAAPGHSPGGVLIFVDDMLFSGDNLVNGSGVITRLPGGNWKIYCDRTRPVIEALPDDTWVCPGHGKPAQLGELRKYLNKFGTV